MHHSSRRTTAGVREYWIIDPDKETVEVYAGQDLTLVATYVAIEHLRSPLLPDLDLPLGPISPRSALSHGHIVGGRLRMPADGAMLVIDGG